jgi:hypothetical protein
VLGESAGRTGGNRPRSSARRRMSDDERAAFTHVEDDPQEWPGELTAGERPKHRMPYWVRYCLILMLNALVMSILSGMVYWHTWNQVALWIIVCWTTILIAMVSTRVWWP